MQFTRRTPNEQQLFPKPHYVVAHSVNIFINLFLSARYVERNHKRLV